MQSIYHLLLQNHTVSSCSVCVNMNISNKYFTCATQAIQNCTSMNITGLFFQHCQSMYKLDAYA